MIDPLKLHSFADGELSEAEIAELREKIARCKESCAELQAIMDAKALAAKVEPVTCDETWKRCVRRLDELDRARRVESWVGRYAWGLCGAFFLAIAAGGYMSRISHAGTMQAGDMQRMVSGLVPSATFTGDLTGAKSWVSDNMPDAPVSFSDDRLQLVRARMGSTYGHRALEAHFRDSRGDVGLLVVRGMHLADANALPGTYQEGSVNDLNYIAWSQNSCAIVVFGTRSRDELQDVADTISSADAISH